VNGLVTAGYVFLYSFIVCVCMNGKSGMLYKVAILVVLVASFAFIENVQAKI